MLRLPYDVYLDMVGHAYDGLPNEACGLLGGRPATGPVDVFYPCGNAAESSRIYTVDPKDHLRADRDAEDRGLEIIGVMHSHTHTDAYPSPDRRGPGARPGLALRHRVAARRGAGAALLPHRRRRDHAKSRWSSTERPD